MLKSNSLIVQSSTLPLDQIIAKFKKIFAEKGVTLFAHIDHAKEAEKAGLELPIEQVLIFGNPKAGTALMQENPEIGIELPLKILIWQGEKGRILIGYKDPLLLSDVYGIKKNQETLKKMSEALHQLVSNIIGVNHE